MGTSREFGENDSSAEVEPDSELLFLFRQVLASEEIEVNHLLLLCQQARLQISFSVLWPSSLLIVIPVLYPRTSTCYQITL